MLFSRILPFMECLRLRVQDIDFARNGILIRDGAGQETMDYLEFILDLRARFSRRLTSPPGRGYSSTMDRGASSMPGGGIQRQGREFNVPWKKEMLILKR
jgi:hypothetical protein